MKISVLASGSGGNACYVETDVARVLIDAGLSCRETERRLGSVGAFPGDVDALVLTHEHTDHIKGAGAFARRFGLPVYINPRTHARCSEALGSLPRLAFFDTGQSIDFTGLTVETFTKCHDAADPVGVVLESGGVRVGIATDLGRSSRLVEDRLQRCHVLILEFNHDPHMLASGPYPLQIKRRIQGPDGHLSNHQAGELLCAVAHDELCCVVLAHLSKTNNEADKAYQEAKNALDRCGHGHVPICISGPDEPSPTIEI